MRFSGIIKIMQLSGLSNEENLKCKSSDWEYGTGIFRTNQNNEIFWIIKLREFSRPIKTMEFSGLVKPLQQTKFVDFYSNSH